MPDTIPPGYPLTTLSAIPVEVVHANEPWTDYWLADGTCIRARLRVQRFRRWGGHFDADGRPIYSHEHLIDFEFEQVGEGLTKRDA